MTAKDIYAQVKAEFDRLDQAHAGPPEWSRLAVTILDGVMKCQAIVIEKQGLAIEAARAVDGAAVANLRQDAKDALYYVDALSGLYDVLKLKLAR